MSIVAVNPKVVSRVKCSDTETVVWFTDGSVWIIESKQDHEDSWISHRVILGPDA